jgi:exosome complex component RRP41
MHVLEAEGSTLCCLVNSTTLVLISAGIAMSDMVSACSVGYVKENLCIDLNQVEQGLGGAYMPVVVKANDEEIVYMQVDNRLSLYNIEIAWMQGI